MYKVLNTSKYLLFFKYYCFYYLLFTFVYLFIYLHICFTSIYFLQYLYLLFLTCIYIFKYSVSYLIYCISKSGTFTFSHFTTLLSKATYNWGTHKAIDLEEEVLVTPSLRHWYNGMHKVLQHNLLITIKIYNIICRPKQRPFLFNRTNIRMLFWTFD